MRIKEYFIDIPTNSVKKVRIFAIMNLIILIWSRIKTEGKLEEGILAFTLTFLLLAFIKEIRNKENGIVGQLLVFFAKPKTNRVVKNGKPRTKKGQGIPNKKSNNQGNAIQAQQKNRKAQTPNKRDTPHIPIPSTSQQRRTEQPSRPPQQVRSHAPSVQQVPKKAPSLTPPSLQPQQPKRQPPKL